MELLDRYLQAVQKHLPWKRQNDILAELKANLEAQVEDKEAALGRPMNQAEAEAWIKDLGDPRRMAVRYAPQRYLIGPAIYPAYIAMLAALCGWVAVIYAILNAAWIITSAPSVSEVSGRCFACPAS